MLLSETLRPMAQIIHKVHSIIFSFSQALLLGPFPSSLHWVTPKLSIRSMLVVLLLPIGVRLPMMRVQFARLGLFGSWTGWGLEPILKGPAHVKVFQLSNCQFKNGWASQCSSSTDRGEGEAGGLPYLQPRALGPLNRDVQKPNSFAPKNSVSWHTTVLHNSSPGVEPAPSLRSLP